MKHLIKLYNTWEKARDTFVKPSLKVYFGKWRNDPNLPVWRAGPPIYICRKKNLAKKCYPLQDTMFIQTEVKKKHFREEEHTVKVYTSSHHKLPNNLKTWDYMWNRDIRKKLKKWHLSWIKPIIYLPSWLRFDVINLDVVWKTKYDDVRYEYPPQFSIIAFGLSLTFTLHCPFQSRYTTDDHYWESILNHIYNNKSGTLKETIENTGIWTTLNSGKDNIDYNANYFAVRPEYIQPNKLEEYYTATSEIKLNDNRFIE